MDSPAGALCPEAFETRTRNRILDSKEARDSSLLESLV